MRSCRSSIPEVIQHPLQFFEIVRKRYHRSETGHEAIHKAVCAGGETAVPSFWEVPSEMHLLASDITFRFARRT